MTHQDILRDFPLAVALIKAEEGFRTTPYKCTAGATTIGYGTNADAHHLDVTGAVWTKSQGESALLDELEIIIAELDRRWPGWRDLDDIRTAVILSACYQLGIYGAAQFKATISALIARDFNAAADRLLASKWANQTPARVKRNAEAIRTGKLPEVVNGVRIFPEGVGEDDVATLAEPAPCVVQALGLRDEQATSDQVVGQVRKVLSTDNGKLAIGGLVISKKLLAACVGLAILSLNGPLGLGLTPLLQQQIKDLLQVYIATQGAVDASALIASIFKSIGGAK